MRTNFFFFFLLLTPYISAQTDSLYVSTEVNDVIYAFDFNGAKNALIDFTKAKHAMVIYQNESQKELNMKIVLDQSAYLAFDSLLNQLGYVNSKKVNTVSNYTKISELDLELNYLRQKKDSYKELLKKLDEKAENYITLWNELKLTEENIFNKEREMLTLNKKGNTYTVTIDLNEEITSPENTGVSFVNMPGFEFSYLSIESPKAGVSASDYQGYFLKYLFTKGKSFGIIGVYKNKEIGKSDATAYSELFMIGFGQDFYSRHLGRGSRKFFNLYSGYTVGGIMATGTTTKKNLLFVSPTIGLELFKNKYFLLDNKVNYFVPLSNNRNLRGWSYNLSFNFVF
jgi:hypothetical protein